MPYWTLDKVYRRPGGMKAIFKQTLTMQPQSTVSARIDVPAMVSMIMVREAAIYKSWRNTELSFYATS